MFMELNVKAFLINGLVSAHDRDRSLNVTKRKCIERGGKRQCGPEAAWVNHREESGMCEHRMVIYVKWESSVSRKKGAPKVL